MFNPRNEDTIKLADSFTQNLTKVMKKLNKYNQLIVNEKKELKNNNFVKNGRFDDIEKHGDTLSMSDYSNSLSNVSVEISF